jgi:toxin ParE1/3/4
MTTKPWRIHPTAQLELDRIAARYERERPGLALGFLDAFAAAWATARSTPQIGTAERIGAHAIRRVQLDGFPHAVVFAELDDRYLVLAVAHGRRRPAYWRSRLRGLAPPPKKT